MKRVDGVVLAAGPSRRFRQTAARAGAGGLPEVKQLLPLGGVSLVRRTARVALGSSLRQVLVVVGRAAEAVRAEVEDLGVRVVHNPRFEEGQSTSVRAALDALDAAAEAALFIPCDQPLLSARTLDRLLAAWRRQGSHIVVPTTAGERRAPVLFARPLFESLARLTGDAGGRQLFATHAESISEVEIDPPAELDDLDTYEDYLGWLAGWRPD